MGYPFLKYLAVSMSVVFLFLSPATARAGITINDNEHIKLALTEHRAQSEGMFFYTLDLKDLAPYCSEENSFNVRIEEKKLIISLPDCDFAKSPPILPVSSINKGSPLLGGLIRENDSRLELALEFEDVPSVGILSSGNIILIAYLTESQNLKCMKSAGACDYKAGLDSGDDTMPSLEYPQPDHLKKQIELMPDRENDYGQSGWSDLDYDEKAHIVSNVGAAAIALLVGGGDMGEAVFKFVKDRLDHVYYGEKAYGIPYGIDMARGIDAQIESFVGDMEQNAIENPWLACPAQPSLGVTNVVVFTAAKRMGNPVKYIFNMAKDILLVGATALEGTLVGSYKTGESLIKGDPQGACDHFTNISINGMFLWATVEGGSKATRGLAPAIKTGWNKFVAMGDDLARMAFPDVGPPLAAEAVTPGGLARIRLTGQPIEAGARNYGGMGSMTEAERLLQGSALLHMTGNTGDINTPGGYQKPAIRGNRAFVDPHKMENGTLVEITTYHGHVYFGRVMKKFWRPDYKGRMAKHLTLRRRAVGGSYKNSDIQFNIVSTCRKMSPSDKYVFYANGEARKFNVNSLIDNNGRPMVILEDIATKRQMILPLDEVIEYNKVFLRTAEDALYGANMFDKRIPIVDLDWTDDIVAIAIKEASGKTPVPAAAEAAEILGRRWIRVELGDPLE